MSAVSYLTGQVYLCGVKRPLLYTLMRQNPITEAVEVTFCVGGYAEYHSFNLSFICGNGANHPENSHHRERYGSNKEIRRLRLDQFVRRNRYCLLKALRRNSEWQD